MNSVVTEKLKPRGFAIESQEEKRNSNLRHPEKNI